MENEKEIEEAKGYSHDTTNYFEYHSTLTFYSSALRRIERNTWGEEVGNLSTNGLLGYNKFTQNQG